MQDAITFSQLRQTFKITVLKVIRVFPKIDHSGKIGKSKINSVKTLPPVGIEPETLILLFYHIFSYTLMTSSLS